MSTNAIIAARIDGWYRAVYLHWDGYPEHAGKILVNHYADCLEIDKLLDEGNISVLGPEIGVQHPFDQKPGNQCTFYGRDRGEDNNEAVGSTSLHEILMEFPTAQYIYIHENQEWKCFPRASLKLPRRQEISLKAFIKGVTV